MNIELLRETCLSYPGAGEDIKWGADLCFVVAEKMFAVTGVEGRFKVTMKVPAEDFDAICARPGIIPAPYLARAKWISVEAPNALTREEWAAMLRQSYDLVVSKLSKKVQRELEA